MFILCWHIDHCLFVFVLVHCFVLFFSVIVRVYGGYHYDNVKDKPQKKHIRSHQTKEIPYNGIKAKLQLTSYYCVRHSLQQSVVRMVNATIFFIQIKLIIIFAQRKVEREEERMCVNLVFFFFARNEIRNRE